MHNRSICFPHFNSDQRSEAANRYVTDLSLMHLRDTDNWLSNTTRPIGANYRLANKWSCASADAITSRVGGRYRHVGGIFSLEWTSRCLVLGVQNRILVWRTPLILNFGVRRRFQDVIYAVRRLNGSPAFHFFFQYIFCPTIKIPKYLDTETLLSLFKTLNSKVLEYTSACK